MFTRVQSRGFVVLSLGLLSIGHSLHGQSVTPPDTASQDKIELSYHVKAIKRDSSGQYTMSGTVNGERQGKATLVFGFDEGSSGQDTGSFVLGSHRGAGFRILQSKIEWNRRGGLGSDPPGRQDHRRRQQRASGRDQQPAAQLRT
jgi:hypothetical protein